MIDAGYVRAMSAYNAAMNGSLYAAAARLTDAERRADRGAFWRSIHGTFSHLLWADRTWMSRFAGWDKPEAALAGSGEAYPDFEAMSALRAATDTDLTAWAGALDDAWITAEQTWFSGAAGRTVTKRRDVLIVHLFNHQAHHRGQAHAMLTAAGQQTGPTDIWLILAEDASGR